MSLGAVARYVVVVGFGPHHSALREGGHERTLVLLLARSGLHVAAVALRTAVLVVGTADRLKDDIISPDVPQILSDTIQSHLI